MLKDSDSLHEVTESNSSVKLSRSTAMMIEKLEKTRQRKNIGKEITQPKELKVSLSDSTNYPDWPKTLGAIPNLFLRSAIFGVGNSGRLLQREKIMGPSGYEIYITGNSLNIKDLHYVDILFSLADNNNESKFTRYRFLKLLKVSDTGDNRKALKSFFSRVIANSIEIVDSKGTNYGYEGSIIIDKKTNENTGEVVITLNPHLRRFFQKSAFTLLNQQISNDLKKHPLAYWLFGYYSSHATPYPINVSTIYEMCRSESENMASFKQCLARALSKVEIAYVKYGQKFVWTINKELVSVNRTATKSQNRHIYKKILSVKA